MEAQRFVIRRKGTLDYFAGFDSVQQPVFAAEDRARTFSDRQMAEAQAYLLRNDDQRVQIKPVVFA